MHSMSSSESCRCMHQSYSSRIGCLFLCDELPGRTHRRAHICLPHSALSVMHSADSHPVSCQSQKLQSSGPSMIIANILIQLKEVCAELRWYSRNTVVGGSPSCRVVQAVSMVNGQCISCYQVTSVVVWSSFLLPCDYCFCFGRSTNLTRAE